MYDSQVDPLSTISAIRPNVTHGQQHVKQPATINDYLNFTINYFLNFTNEFSDTLIIFLFIYIETYKC